MDAGLCAVDLNGKICLSVLNLMIVEFAIILYELAIKRRRLCVMTKAEMNIMYRCIYW